MGHTNGFSCCNLDRLWKYNLDMLGLRELKLRAHTRGSIMVDIVCFRIW